MEIHVFENRNDFWSVGATKWHSRALFQIEYQLDRLTEREAYEAASQLWDVAEMIIEGMPRLLVLEALADCTTTSIPGLTAAAASAHDWISDSFWMED